MMSSHPAGAEPRTGTYPSFGDNLVGNLPEEDGVDQRAEPPSWRPEGARPGTGAGADVRTPENTEAAETGPGDVTDYVFSPDTTSQPSQNGQDGQPGADGTYGPQGSGYGYGAAAEPDSTARVPPYPGPATGPGAYPDPAPEAEAEPAPPASTVTPQPWAGQENRDAREAANRTTAIPAPPRDRYLPGGQSARPAPAGPAGAPVTAAARPGGAQARRADLVLARLEPWSVMKFSFLMSLVAWVVLFVAVAFLYFMLSSLGVFSSLQHTLGSVTSSSGSSGMNLSHWFSASRILGYTMLLGAVNIVLLTALSTVGAMIYNLVTRLGGGIEVTLRESD
jgi:hypothetical protein